MLFVYVVHYAIDFVCYIVKLPLELVPSREKVGICLKPMLCPCLSKDAEKRKRVGRTQMDLPSMGVACEKYSYNFHGSETLKHML